LTNHAFNDWLFDVYGQKNGQIEVAVICDQNCCYYCDTKCCVEFGMVGFTGGPLDVKYAGSGKVLNVV